MKRIHYLLLGLLVSLTIAAVSPTMPPTRIAPGTNVTVVTNGMNSFTISAAGAAGAVMNQNQFDGTSTNIKAGVTITNLQANGVTSASYLTTQQTAAYASGTNVTVTATNNLHFLTLTNTTYFPVPSGLTTGCSFTVILKQDATGVRAVTFDTNYWKFPSGTQPTITTNANAYDVLSCISCPFGTNVFAVINQYFR